MKYNVGDKVVKMSDLTILFNPYWKKERRAGLIQTVTEANENLFTIHNNKGSYNTTLENARSCGIREYLAYRQESGYCFCWATKERLLHLEHDREEIRSIVEADGMKCIEKTLSRLLREIESRERQIELELSAYDEDLRINRELLGLTAHA